MYARQNFINNFETKNYITWMGKKQLITQNSLSLPTTLTAVVLFKRMRIRTEGTFVESFKLSNFQDEQFIICHPLISYNHIA